jgi:hypothetical protein
MKITKENIKHFLQINWATLVLLLCISCAASAPEEEAIKKDWEAYCKTVLKESFNCSGLRIVDKKAAGDDCEVIIAAKSVTEPEREAEERKFKFIYKKFDNSWSAISVDPL